MRRCHCRTLGERKTSSFASSNHFTRRLTCRRFCSSNACPGPGKSLPQARSRSRRATLVAEKAEGIIASNVTRADTETRFLPPTAVAYFADGSPVPEVLTAEEACRYLRLDEIDIEDPTGTLNYYRKRGLLRATQVGKCVRYRRIELDRLLDRLTDENPR
jgi:hypothetical protein